MARFDWLESVNHMVARARYILANPEFCAMGEIQELEDYARLVADGARHLNGGDWCEEMDEAFEAARLLEESAKQLREEYFPNT
jgi:hypothetical protein